MRASDMAKICQGSIFRFILVACAMGGAIAFSGNRALAQNITLDGTLGPARTLIGPNYPILQTDGQTVGTNLFHSFGQFNLIYGETATFQSMANISNILARVTGGSISNIDGLIQSSSKANIFLINPNGIIFGPHAQLNVGGSFVGTTASAIRFPNGGEFSQASTPATLNNPILAVNPSALFFNQTPAAVSVNQATLQVKPGRDLFLVGGNVTLKGAEPEQPAVISASGGRVELGGLATTGTVEIVDITGGKNPSLKFPRVGLQFPQGAARANVSLTNASIDVGTSSKLAGDVYITAGDQLSLVNSEVSSRSTNDLTSGFSVIQLSAQGSVSLNNSILSTSNFGSGYSGDIRISAPGQVSIVNGSSLFSQGNLGNIYIGSDTGNPNYNLLTPRSVTIDNATLKTTGFGSGIAGDIVIRASDQIAVTNNSEISSRSENDRTDAFGFIELAATQGSVLLNNSTLSTTSSGSGFAGDILIYAADQISIENQSNIFSNGNFGRILIGKSDAYETSFSPKTIKIADSQLTTRNTDLGERAGDVRFDAIDNISMTNTLISSSTFGSANAGSVFIKAESVSAANSGIFSQVAPGATGEGGGIKIVAGSFSLTAETQVSTSSSGQGDAGLITVLADGAVSLKNGSSIDSRVEAGATGDAGGIGMQVGSLSVANNSRISTSNYGTQGSPGAIIVFANDDISLTGGSGIFSQSGPDTINGNNASGQIGLVARTLFVKDDSTVRVNNQGSGGAGDIVITTREDIILRNQATLSATATSGQGGNIVLLPDTFLLLLENSRISTTSGFEGKGGDGGNVGIVNQYTIAAPFDDNNINANAFTGTGGNITIFSNRLYDIEKRPDARISNDITASSEYGLDGTVSDTVVNVDPTQGLSNLPANTVDPTRLIAETCAPRGGITERQNNQFIVTRRGGLPPDPNAAFPGEAVVTDQGTPNQQSNQPNSPNSTNPTSSSPVATPSPRQQEQPNNRHSTNTSATPKATASPQEPIVEAQGWVYDKNGDVTFTNESPTVTPNHSELIPASTCNGLSTQPQSSLSASTPQFVSSDQLPDVGAKSSTSR